MTPEQSSIVWDATLEAAKDLEGLAMKIAPRAFELRQVDADANKMVRRYLVKNLDAKLPALEATKATAKKLTKETIARARGRKRVPPIPPFKPKIPVDKIPRPIVPRRPKMNMGWVLLLALVLLGGRDS